MPFLQVYGSIGISTCFLIVMIKAQLLYANL